jgi:hypothetical protein
MPPIPLRWQGCDLAHQFLTATATPHLRRKLVATRANGQPAFGIYVRDPRAVSCTGPGCWYSPWPATGSVR